MNIREIARVAHEMNRRWCQLTGDDSQPHWDYAPDWQQESAVSGVRYHLQGERSPRESHEEWMRHKRTEGWKLGPVKDPVKKEHPCMVPYESLPSIQRAKDSIFSAVVEGLK